MRYVKPQETPFETPLMAIAVNENWMGFLLGQLEHLLDPNKWEGTTEEQHTAVDQLMELMNYMSADCDCLTTLEWNRGRGLRYYADGDWHDVPGSANINLYWDAATYLSDTADGAPMDDSNDHRCGGVKGLIEAFLIPRYKDALDTLQLYVDGFIKLEDAMVKVLSTLTLGLSETLPFDEFVGWMNSFQQFAFAQAFDVLNDPDWQEEIEQELYCAMKAIPTATLSESIWVDWRDYVGDTYGIQVHGMGSFLDKYVFEEIRKRYNVYALTPSTFCEGLGWCPAEVNYLDHFTSGMDVKTYTYTQLSMTSPFGADGEYSSTGGKTDVGSWVSNVGSGNNRPIAIAIDLGAEYTLIQAAVQHRWNVAGKGRGLWIGTLDGDKQPITPDLVSLSDNSHTDWQKAEWTGSRAGVRYIVFLGNGLYSAVPANRVYPFYFDEIEVTWQE